MKSKFLGVRCLAPLPFSPSPNNNTQRKCLMRFACTMVTVEVLWWGWPNRLRDVQLENCQPWPRWYGTSLLLQRLLPLPGYHSNMLHLGTQYERIREGLQSKYTDRGWLRICLVVMIEVAQFLVQVYLNVIKPFFFLFVLILIQFLHVTKYAYCAQTELALNMRSIDHRP